MLFVSNLTKPEKISLQSMNREHPTVWTRVRANAVLLSHEGQSIGIIASIHGVSRQTISIWLKSWEAHGLCGLFDKPGRGRRTKVHCKDEILDRVRDNPRSLKCVLVRIKDELGIDISLSTLKRLCKKANLSWKRFRKSLKGKRNPIEFDASVEIIKSLNQQADNGDINLVYFDESGFTLEPCIPYAWHVRGETLCLPSARSARLNVLGFMDRDSQLESFVFEESINSSVVVACFDAFAKTIENKTVVIIDNAPTHTSGEFKQNIDRWETQGLIVQPISSYSPELNLIEILWRKIKYEWMPFLAYGSFSALKDGLFEILSQVGRKYSIEFA